jgi:hypothetical protein
MKTKNSILLLFSFFLLIGLTACSQPVDEEPVQKPQEVTHVYPEPFYDPQVVASEVEALLSGESLPSEEQEVAAV